jgi:hypothetical protein
VCEESRTTCWQLGRGACEMQCKNKADGHHASRSNPGAPLGRRSLRPRRQDGGSTHVTIGNKKHTAGAGTRRIFHQKIPSAFRQMLCYVNGKT